MSGYTIRNSQFTNSFILPANTYLTPNEHIIITPDSNRFRKYFPNVRLFGNYTFNLSFNDKIRIYDMNGRLKFTTDFASTAAWPQKANGAGFTLELNDTASLYSLPSSWFDGCFGGSPGFSYQPCNSLAKVSEINAQSHPLKNSGDWIEILNTGSGYINMQGWKAYNHDSTLTATFDRPLVIKPLSYLIISSDSFKFDVQNPGVERIAGLFNLADSGETIHFYDADNALMTTAEYHVGNGWPSGANGLGHTYEKKVLSGNPALPSSWFIGCIGGSPGRAFSPCQEAIVMSEINYASNSKTDAGDWLELYNTSNNTVDISSWRLSSYDNTRSHYIKNGAQLQPKERYVLYSNPTKFKEVYGSLPTSGEQVFFELQSKDAFILVSNQSKLMYSNGWDSVAPFPDANQSVYTLERIDTAVGYFAGENWTTGCPAGSPGTGIVDCQGILSASEINASSEGWYQTGDWIELANLNAIPFNPIDYTIASAKNPGKAYKVKTNKMLFKGDRFIVVEDSLRFMLTTGLTDYESSLPFGLDNS
ncbi:MAG: lamin tail domain-containing protein, partial [Bacteroidetes bacterium]|nr:lamin tail domain-containing protein [Bacteroidota bacterium]